MIAVSAGLGLGFGLNRTSVGLKPRLKTLSTINFLKPQSNQRGIETGDPRQLLDPGGLGLNRTSVGLKRDIVAMIVGILNGLNRTSVGLKLGWMLARMNGGWRLNRTSVGLKLSFPTPTPPTGGTPQSNQRGIETR